MADSHPVQDHQDRDHDEGDPRHRQGPATLVHARGLTKRFGGFTAVDGIDFDLVRGEAFGFLGPNGAIFDATFNVCCASALAQHGQLRVPAGR